MSELNLADIQGLVFRSYRPLPHASYVLLRFRTNPAAAQCWLAAFVDKERIDSAVPKETGPIGSPDVRLNIAFTYQGLEALGLCRDTLATFPLEFEEGLGKPWSGDEPDHRSRILGDVDTSRPDEWRWGYQGDARAVHAVLLAFARDPIVLDERVGGWIHEAEALGAIEPRTAVTLWGRFPDNPHQPNREPFGFVDGISQPILKGATARLGGHSRPKQPPVQEIDDGEILLGHRDGSRLRAAGPTVARECDKNDVLPPAHDDTGRRDLGHNGTYLVFRQLAQHVELFERACAEAGAASGLTADHVGALIVGRWKDGSPLISAPIEHDPQLVDGPAANDFMYADDPHGERCPMGAHIRRANPRDALGDHPSQSLTVSNRHRILRRGRPYYAADKERGLHFIALNASIARQFEFIQQNWINDPTFNGLSGEDDPLLGARQGVAVRGQMTLPPPPENRVGRRVDGLNRFVTVKGGGYFFLPSLTALRYLAHERAAPEPPKLWRAATAAPTSVDRIRGFALARFSALFALLLLAAPFAVFARSTSTVVKPNFDLDHWLEMGIVALLASLAAAGLQLSFRVLQLYAYRRFGVNLAASPLTWRVVFTWQALTLPVVATAWWLSANDAAVASGRLRFALAEYGGAAVGGYAVAFALLFVASAARMASVRPQYAMDAVLLPAPRLPRRNGEPALVTKLVAPISRFIESRAAMLPSGVGAGYVDPDTGRILPGHLTTLAFVTTLAVVYGVGWFWLRPPTRFQPPPLAYFLFIVLVTVLVTSAAAFFFDKFRVPLLTLLLTWFVFATVFAGTDYEFPVSGKLVAPPSIPNAIATADAHYPWSGELADRPLVVVVAAGGGIRQAGWTMQVLAGLTRLFGTDFSGNLRLVSAVSGGSIGVLPFLNAYTSSSAPSGDLQPLIDAAEASGSADIWWGLVYADAVRAAISYPPRAWFSRTRDRGWALEQAWRRAVDVRKTAPTLGGWRQDGWRPSVAFNATVVETGERAVLATYAVPAVSAGATAIDAAQATNDNDLSVFTAARLSATFPYVTPVARLDEAYRKPGDPFGMRHFADGGYWDNTGMVSALEWLRESGVLGRRRVLVIQIAPAQLGETVVRDRAWVWQWTAPMSTLVAVRTDAQQARTAIEIQAMKDLWGDNVVFATIKDPGKDASLGWHLSREEKRTIADCWGTINSPQERQRPDSPIATIARFFSTSLDPSSVELKTCRP